MNPSVYALIIGVGDYTAFDPSGAADLPGARNDVKRWAHYLQTVLLLGKDQYRLLSDEDDPSATSRDSIVDGLQWLAEKIAGVEGRSGLITFSGHGLAVDSPRGEVADGLSLGIAPSDIAPDLEAALRFSDIQQILHDRIHAMPCQSGVVSDTPSLASHLLKNITVVLDCCYSQVEEPAGRRSRSLPTVASGSPMDQGVWDRLMIASQLWEPAYEIRSAGQSHGAFTFALVTLLEQWALGTDDQTHVNYVTVSYGDLMFRVREMVRVLGASGQQPALLGRTKNLPLLPFLRPGNQLEHGWTSAEPNGLRLKEEFSSGNTDSVVLRVEGRLNEQLWRSIATCVVMGENNGPKIGYDADGNNSHSFAKDSTIWFFDLDAINGGGFDSWRISSQTLPGSSWPASRSAWMAASENGGLVSHIAEALRSWTAWAGQTNSVSWNATEPTAPPPTEGESKTTSWWFGKTSQGRDFGLQMSWSRTGSTVHTVDQVAFRYKNPGSTFLLPMAASTALTTKQPAGSNWKYTYDEG